LQVLRNGTDGMAYPSAAEAQPTQVNTQASTVSAGVGVPDYTGMAVPSVWRTNRTHAAAKVDAMSSGGMDDYEIPAFLRKQAD
jgi:cell division protein FtsZ